MRQTAYINCGGKKQASLAVKRGLDALSGVIVCVILDNSIATPPIADSLWSGSRRMGIHTCRGLGVVIGEVESFSESWSELHN